MDFETVSDCYENGAMWEPGTEISYRGYRLRKASVGMSPEHTEFKIVNREGVIVESFTVGAFSSADELKQRLDEVIEFDPRTMEEWLSR